MLSRAIMALTELNFNCWQYVDSCWGQD